MLDSRQPVGSLPSRREYASRTCTSKFVTCVFPVSNALRDFSLLLLKSQPVGRVAVDVYLQSAQHLSVNLGGEILDDLAS